VITLGIFPNTRKQGIATVLEWLLGYLQKYRQVKVLMPQDSALKLGYPDLACPSEDLPGKLTLALSLGGDGTLLNTVRQVMGAGVPVCGVNLGQLGFLAEIELNELRTAMDKLISGDYFVEERLMLEAAIVRQDKVTETCWAINDVVIAKGGFSRMIKLNVFIDGELTVTYPADGLIVATSTGSTGYSLSAGGPIINPSLKVIELTPICPHTLHSRSLIINEDEEIKVSLEATHEDIALTVDGQNYYRLLPHDTVIIRRAPLRAKFVRFHDKSYYRKLRTKLRRGDAL